MAAKQRRREGWRRKGERPGIEFVTLATYQCRQCPAAAVC